MFDKCALITPPREPPRKQRAGDPQEVVAVSVVLPPALSSTEPLGSQLKSSPPLLRQGVWSMVPEGALPLRGFSAPGLAGVHVSMAEYTVRSCLRLLDSRVRRRAQSIIFNLRLGGSPSEPSQVIRPLYPLFIRQFF